MSRTAAPGRHHGDVRSRALMLVLRTLIAAGLVLTAVIHLQLASGYQQVPHDGVGQGALFRLQAVASLAVALYVLAWGARTAYLVAAVTGLSALAVVVITRYVPLPAIGPLPSMYEPVWYPAKTLSAVAEAAAATLACVGYLMLRRARQHRGTSGLSPERPSSP